MPRKPKSPEELESFEGHTPIEGETERQINKDIEERKDEVERTIQRRAPRKKKVEEVAEIEKTKAEIIEKMGRNPSEKPLWEQETGTKKRINRKVAIEDKEGLLKEPVAETVVRNEERSHWETKYEYKLQQPKKEAAQNDSFIRRIWKKIRVPFIATAFTASGLLASHEAKATNGDPADSVAKKERVKESKVPFTLPQQEMSDWNDFVDFLDMKGLKGSTELEANGGQLGKQLMEEYITTHPGTTVSYETIAKIQKAMEGTRDNVQDFAKRHNDPDANKLMTGISKVDRLLGHKTSQFKFPLLRKTEKKIGLVNAEFPASQRKFPPGAKLISYNGKTYYQDDNGYHPID